MKVDAAAETALAPIELEVGGVRETVEVPGRMKTGKLPGCEAKRRRGLSTGFGAGGQVDCELIE